MVMKKSKWRLSGTITLPLVGGTIAGMLATRSAKKKYRHLRMPKFAPPSWVFPVAWTSLYALMGVAKYQYDRTSQKRDRKSTRLNSSHVAISYAVFCLKKKKKCKPTQK